MKRILLACFLLTTVCTVGSFQRVSAQVHISATAFSSEVNLMDSYIAASNMTMAQSTWDSVHHMMINILAYTKHSISTAATPADKAAYTTVITTQRNLYSAIWVLKTDLATNRTAIHGKLMEFDATIY